MSVRTGLELSQDLGVQQNKVGEIFTLQITNMVDSHGINNKDIIPNYYKLQEVPS